MASFQWSYAKVEQLIDVIENRECLYNTKSKDYHNRDKRRSAMQEIATALTATGTGSTLHIILERVRSRTHTCTDYRLHALLGEIEM